MDPKELKGLMEAYSEVYAPQEVDEEMKPLPKEKMKRQSMKAYKKERIAIDRRDDPEANKQMQRRIAMQSPASRRNVLQNKKMGEEFDIFDTVLEFLQVEGYAETLEEAEWLMANVIDEEAIEIIVGEEQLDEISKELAGRVVNARIAKTGAAFDREMKDRTPENMRDSGEAASKEGRAKRLAAGVRTRRNATNEDYMDEAQVANRDPDKYEAGQQKKSAPVRGEKTPMPPRGDKRREDFEKWYAANVR